jgi:valyl-tRNA synthetase
LTLLHPFTPFVTEVLWEKMGHSNFLILRTWPKANSHHDFPKARKEMDLLISIVKSIRQMRVEYRVEPAKWVEVTIYAHRSTSVLKNHVDFIKKLVRVNQLNLQSEGQKVSHTAVQSIGSVEVHVHLEGLIDLTQEKKRLEEDLKSTMVYLKGLNAKLSHKGYLKNAPAAIVEQDRERQEEASGRVERMKEQLKSL